MTLLQLSLKMVFLLVQNTFKWVEIDENVFVKNEKYTPDNSLFNGAKTNVLALMF